MATTVAAFEAVLIPIGPGVYPGAHGSVWEVVFHERNTGTQPVCDISPSPIPEPRCIGPGQSTMFDDSSFAPVVLYYEGPVDALQFSLLARDVSRDTESWGAEIPVVRERDLLTDKGELINVPTSTRFRRNLRIYSMALEAVSVIVRVWDAERDFILHGNSTPRLLGEATFHLDPSRWHLSLGDLDGLFPEMATTTLARIEIEQVPKGHKLWAFVSITNVATQHVTTISPQ